MKTYVAVKCGIKRPTILTTKTKREPIKNNTYPNRFRFLVLIFASLYASKASVPTANG